MQLIKTTRRTCSYRKYSGNHISQCIKLSQCFLNPLIFKRINFFHIFCFVTKYLIWQRTTKIQIKLKRGIMYFPMMRTCIQRRDVIEHIGLLMVNERPSTSFFVTHKTWKQHFHEIASIPLGSQLSLCLIWSTCTIE